MAFNIYLPIRQVEAINKLADARGLNRSALVGEAIDTLLRSSDDFSTVQNGKEATYAR
jgi:hypothetical protein